MPHDLPLTEPDTHGCGCHDTGLPTLDARVIPGAIRHGAILGALSQVRPGAGMILVAPHDPLPLLDQVRETFGEGVEIGYVDREADLAAGDGVRVTLTKTHP